MDNTNRNSSRQGVMFRNIFKVSKWVTLIGRVVRIHSLLHENAGYGHSCHTFTKILAYKFSLRVETYVLFIFVALIL